MPNEKWLNWEDEMIDERSSTGMLSSEIAARPELDGLSTLGNRKKRPATTAMTAFLATESTALASTLAFKADLSGGGEAPVPTVNSIRLALRRESDDALPHGRHAQTDLVGGDRAVPIKSFA
jgi:hypothetical protein